MPRCRVPRCLLRHRTPACHPVPSPTAPYLTITLVALVAAGLTFFSGFGLGMLLLPAFALFMPVEVAIGATAVAHLANNLYKVALMARHADRGITPIFAGFSVIGALARAWLLTLLAGGHTLHTYTMSGRSFEVTMIGLVIGIMMIAFAILELTPATSKWGLPRTLLWLGGLLSGFFGGLSGHQGACTRRPSSDPKCPKTPSSAPVRLCGRRRFHSPHRLRHRRSARRPRRHPTDQARDTLRTLHEHNACAIATGCVAALIGTTIGNSPAQGSHHRRRAHYRPDRPPCPGHRPRAGACLARRLTPAGLPSRSHAHPLHPHHLLRVPLLLTTLTALRVDAEPRGPSTRTPRRSPSHPPACIHLSPCSRLPTPPPPRRDGCPGRPSPEFDMRFGPCPAARPAQPPGPVPPPPAVQP